MKKKYGSRYLAFSSGGFELGLDMADVVSVERSEPGVLKKSSLPGPDVHSYNGKTIPLWNVSDLLDTGVARSVPNEGARILVLRSRTGLFALRIGQVRTVFDTQEAQIFPMPSVFKGQAMVFSPRILRTRQTLFALIDPDTFEKIALTQLARLVGTPENDGSCPAPLKDKPPLPQTIPHPGTAPHDADAIVTGDMLTASITRIVKRKVRQRLAQLMSEPSVEKIGQSLLEQPEALK